MTFFCCILNQFFFVVFSSMHRLFITSVLSVLLVINSCIPALCREHAAAIATYESALAKKDDLRARFELAEDLLKSGKTQEAVDNYLLVVQKKPSLPERDNRIRLEPKVYEQSPSYKQLISKARQQANMGDLEESIKTYSKALEKKEDPYLWIELGDIFVKLGKLKQDNKSFWNATGCYEKAQNKAGSLSEEEREKITKKFSFAVDFASEYDNIITDAEGKIENPSEAITLFKKAQSTLDDVRGRIKMADAYYQFGNTSEALANYQLAVKHILFESLSNSTKDEVWTKLALSANKIGLNSIAQSALQEATHVESSVNSKKSNKSNLSFIRNNPNGKWSGHHCPDDVVLLLADLKPRNRTRTLDLNKLKENHSSFINKIKSDQRLSSMEKEWLWVVSYLQLAQYVDFQPFQVDEFDSKLKNLAERDYPPAQFLHGVSITAKTENSAKGLVWIEKAYQAGYIKAAYWLVEYHLFDSPVKNTTVPLQILNWAEKCGLKGLASRIKAQLCLADVQNYPPENYLHWTIKGIKNSDPESLSVGMNLLQEFNSIYPAVSRAIGKEQSKLLSKLTDNQVKMAKEFALSGLNNGPIFMRNYYRSINADKEQFEWLTVADNLTSHDMDTYFYSSPFDKKKTLWEFAYKDTIGSVKSKINTYQIKILRNNYDI